MTILNNYKVLGVLGLSLLCLFFYALYQNKIEEIKTLNLNIAICKSANQSNTKTVLTLKKEVKEANNLSQKRLKLKDKIIASYKASIQKEIDKEEQNNVQKSIKNSDISDDTLIVLNSLFK